MAVIHEVLEKLPGRALDPGDRARRGAGARAGGRWSAGRVSRFVHAARGRALCAAGLVLAVDAGPGAGRRRGGQRHHRGERGDRRDLCRRALRARRGREPERALRGRSSPTADNLSDADNDSVVNIYLHDRETGETSWSAAPRVAGAGADADSTNPAISPGGAAVVAFESRATNLSDADGDATSDVFVRDLETGITTLVSRRAGRLARRRRLRRPVPVGERRRGRVRVAATNLSDLDHDASHGRLHPRPRRPARSTLVSRPGIGRAGGRAPRSTPRFRPTGAGSRSPPTPTTCSSTTATSTRTCMSR